MEEREGYDLDLDGGMKRCPAVEEVLLEDLEMEEMATARWVEDMA